MWHRVCRFCMNVRSISFVCSALNVYSRPLASEYLHLSNTNGLYGDSIIDSSTCVSPVVRCKEKESFPFCQLHLIPNLLLKVKHHRSRMFYFVIMRTSKITCRQNNSFRNTINVMRIDMLDHQLSLDLLQTLLLVTLLMAHTRLSL